METGIADTNYTTDKGECYFQPIVVGDGPIAWASLRQIRNAANALLITCAIGTSSQGGIITNIGENFRFFLLRP